MAAARDELIGGLFDGRLDRAQAGAELLRVAGMSLVEIFDDVVAPALDGMGTSFGDRGITPAEAQRVAGVAGELATRLRPVRRPDERTPHVVVAALPGERHVLGLQLLGCVLADAGWHVTTYGAMEVSLLIEGCLCLDGVDAIALSTSVADTETLRSAIRTIRSSLDVRVVVGGRGVRMDPLLAGAVGADGGAATLQDGLAVMSRVAMPLSLRELEALQLVANGLTNRQIARELGVAPSTVKTWIENILDKLDVPDRASAAAVAIRNRWID